MASWLGSLDSVVRLQSAAVWLTVFFALTAAASGVASYFLSRRATALRAEASARELAAAREEVQIQLAAGQSELEESRRLLQEAEERSAGFLDRIESLEQELAQKSEARPASTPPAAARPTPKPPAAAPAETRGAGFLSAEQGNKLTRALAGKPSGAITLVAISGDRDSLVAARRLAAFLTTAGWTPEVIEARFQTRPDGLIFVVHSPNAVPERQYFLAQALAEAGLMKLPVKMTVNPSRPEDFLGLLVGAPGG